MYITLNGHMIKIEDPGEIVNTIFSSVCDLNYWSYEALKELYIGVFDIVSKYCVEKRKTCFGSKKTKFTRFISKNEYRFLPRNKEKMLLLIYEFILSSEGLGRSHGFGFSNKFGDKIQGNSETSRLTKDKSIE